MWIHKQQDAKAAIYEVPISFAENLNGKRAHSTIIDFLSAYATHPSLFAKARVVSFPCQQHRQSLLTHRFLTQAARVSAPSNPSPARTTPDGVATIPTPPVIAQAHWRIALPSRTP